MLRANLHLRKETIHQVDGGEEYVIGQVIPDFEAPENVCGSVTSTDGYFTFLCAKEKQLAIRLDKVGAIGTLALKASGHMTAYVRPTAEKKSLFSTHI